MPVDQLSTVFAALADPTRRAILARLTAGEATVTELGQPHDMSLPAISKHLKVLERAGLITRGRNAQWRPCRLHAAPLEGATAWLERYRRFWDERWDRLDEHLRTIDSRTTPRGDPMTEMKHYELTLTRTFDAPHGAVWKAYTEPEQLARWWGPKGFHTPLDKIEVDLRPGGAYNLTMVDGEGNEYPSEMTIRELVEPERLAFGWDAQRGIGAGEIIVVLSELDGGRTQLDSHFAGDSTPEMMSMMEAGTNQQLDKLAALLQGS